MSTRGAIVRFTNGETTEFAGRYHHWDSPPPHLGATLWALYHGHFQRDLRRMLEVLIDEHPAGWSTINNKDFSMEPGYAMQGEHPVCYCHGARSEEEHLVTHETAADIGCEYVYGFDEGPTLVVLASFCEDGGKMIGMFGMGDPKAVWKEIGRVPLDGPEPDWDRIQCGEYLERCGHIDGYHEERR